MKRDGPTSLSANPLILPALALAGGITAGRYCNVFLSFYFCLLGFSFLSGAVLFLHPRLRSRTWTGGVQLLALCLGFVAVGGMRFAYVWNYYPADHIARYANEDSQLVSLRGTIITDPYVARSRGALSEFDFLHEPRTICYLRCEEFKTIAGWSDCSGKALLILEEPALHLKYGQRLELDGILLQRGRAMNPGQVNRSLYHRAAHCLVQVRVEHTDALQCLNKPDNEPRFAVWRKRLRDLAHAALLDDAGRPEAIQSDATQAFQEALLLGQRHGLDGDLNETFIRSGTMHYLSLSGLHVGILAAFVWWLAGLLRLPRWGRGVVAITFLVLFLLLAPPRAPILRAGVLSIVFCIAYMTRRDVSSLNVLALGAIVVLLWRPLDLFMPGFQLSFLVVLAIIVFVAPLVSHMPLLLRRSVPYEHLPISLRKKRPFWKEVLVLLRRGLWGLFVLSVVAYLAGLPLMAYHFHRFALWGIPASVALSLPIFLTLLLGFAKLLLAGILPTAAGWLGGPLDGLSWLNMKIAAFFAGLPGATVTTGSLPTGMVFAWYGIVLWLAWKLRPRRAIHRLADVLHFWTALTVPVWKRPVFWPTIALCGWIGLFILGMPCRGITGCKPAFHVLAVGHGCCVVGELSDGSVIIYDAGSMSNFGVAESTIVPFLRSQGIGRIDRLYLSHANLDHYSGVIDLCRRIPVRAIYTNPYFQKALEEAPDYTALGSLQQEFELRNQDIQVFTREKIVDSPLHNPQTTILWPPPQEDPSLSVNDHSLILHVRDRGVSVLLCGDIGERPEQALLDAASDDLHADVLLLPHHGAVDKSLDEFVAAVCPEIIVNSSQRMPASRLEKLRTALPDPEILHTWRHGCISIHPQNGSLVVEPFNDGP